MEVTLTIFYCRRDTVKTMVKLYARQMQLEMAGKESSAKILLDVIKDGDLGDKILAKRAADMEVAKIKRDKAQFQPTTSTATVMKAGKSQHGSTQQGSKGDIFWLYSHLSYHDRPSLIQPFSAWKSPILMP